MASAQIAELDSSTDPSPSPSPSWEIAASDDTPNMFQARIFSLIRAKYHFALAFDGSLAVYSDGWYVPADSDWVRDAIFDLINGKPNLEGKYSLRLRLTIEDMLKAKQPKLWLEPPADRICVLNGIIDIPSGRLLPHSPTDWLSTIYLPIVYDPKAKSPLWDQYLEGLFPEGGLDLAYEFIGSCISANRMIHQALWLEGEGSNGKSTFVLAVESLLGKHNCQKIPVETLEHDMFALVGVIGKLLVYDIDVKATEPIERSQRFKEIITGDPLHIRPMRRHGFTHRPFCTMIVAGNVAMDSYDTSFGMTRRILPVPFGALRGADEAKVMDQADLLQTLAKPQELSGALNQAIKGWRRLREKNGNFSIPVDSQDAIEEALEHTPQYQFAAQRILFSDSPDAIVSPRELRTAYLEFMDEVYPRNQSSRRISIVDWLLRVHSDKISYLPRKVIEGGKRPPRSIVGITLRTGM